MIKARGVHHGAYLTRDMDKTVKFFTEILDMPLTVTLQLPSPDPFGGNIQQWGDLSGTKHYFFDCGNGDCIAFFSWNESFGEAKPEAGILHHLAFKLDTVEELYEAKKSLESKGVECSDVIDHFFCKSLYFKDYNGMYLEFAVSSVNYTAETPFLEDAHPVPAALNHLGDKQKKFFRQFREGHDFVDTHKKTVPAA